VSFILDTDHCIAILRGRLDICSKAEPTTPLFITAITVSELSYGAYKSQRPEHHLAQVDLLIAGVTVLPFDTAAGKRCGMLKDSLRRAGNPIAEPDLQIASIALENTLPLVTHNQKHFNRIPGLELDDWL
jgi:tRNA(fMet)-specific endonuclease VapC